MNQVLRYSCFSLIPVSCSMVSLSSIVSRLWRFRIAFITILFVLGAGIFDEHSALNIFLLTRNNHELQQNIAQFEQQYKEDSRALRLMDNSPEAVEKVARVKLFMKKANEDVYVVVNDSDE